MRLRHLFQLLTGRHDTGLPGFARRNYRDELFPELVITRLEERRLLNAAPVAAPSHTVQEAAATTAAHAKETSHQSPTSEVSNLAAAMYRGPADGQFTVEMTSLTHHASRGQADRDALAEVSTSAASPGTIVSPGVTTASGLNNASPAILSGADQPPVNAVPGAQHTNQNTPLVIQGISVADPDSGSNPISTQLTVTNGTLNVDTTGGVVQPGGAILLPDGTVIVGNGTNTLSIVGTTTQISTELSHGLTYTPTANYHGADTLTMVSNDLGNTGVGGPLKDTDTVAITVLQVDQPPVNTVPGAQHTNQNTPLVIQGISVTDPDSGNNPINTQFTVANGTLTVDTTGGVVQPGGAILLPDGTVIVGNGTNTLSIVGTTTQISTELSHGLTYTPSANFHGSDSLTMVSNDLGNTGVGGPLKDTDPVAITVVQVDQPPVNTVTGPQSTHENTPLVINGLSVADPDSGNNPINTQFTIANGTLTVDTTGGAVQPGGAILLPDGTVIVGNGTNTLSIVGTTTQISTELSHGLTYTPTTNYHGSDTLTMVSNDLGNTGVGGPLKDTDPVAITVVQVDQPPVNTVPGPQTTNENTPLVIQGISVTDPDSGNNPITTQLTVTSGTLTVDTTGGAVQPGGAILLPDGTVIVGNGTNTLSIVGTTAQISTELSHGLTYTPTANFHGSDTLTMVSNDLGNTGVGGPLKDTDPVAITVVQVDQPPVNTVPGPLSTHENTALVIQGISVTDPDSGSNPINTQFTVANGTLTVDTTGGIVQPGGAILLPDGTVILGNGTGTLTISGTTTQISAELSHGLTYTPSTNFHGSDTLTMVSNDLGNTGVGGPLKDTDTVAITVVQVDQPPVNTVPGPQSTLENTPLVIQGISVTDPDSGNNPISTQLTVTNGTLTVDTTGGVVQPGGAILLPDGTVILGNGTGTLTISGTTTQISAELSHGLTYTPSTNFHGSDTLTMVSNDLGNTGVGGPLKDTDTVAITVVQVDQPPVNTVPGPQSTLENTPLVIQGISVTDPDSGNNPINTQFTVANGTLTVDTTGGVVQPGGAILLPDGTVIVGNGTNTLSIVGTTTQISTELSHGLTYTPSTNYHGADTLTMVSNDLGNTGVGGPLKDTDTVAITVLQVDQPPVNTVPGPQSTNENTPLVIQGLSVTDPDSGNNPISTQFTVANGTLAVDTTGGVVQPGGAILLPDGTVILGNGTNTLTIVGTTTQISAELSHGLTYTPTTNYHGSDTLTMVSNDLGNTGVGGPLKDTDTVAITVLAANQNLTLTGLAGTNVLQGSTSTLTGVITSTEGSSFSVSVNWGDGSALQTFAVNSQGQFTLTHVYLYGDGNPSPTEVTPISVTVVDNLGLSTTGSTSIVVTNVAPSVSDLAVTPTQIKNGNAGTLTGAIADPGPFDTFTMTINWGDNTAPQVVSLPAGTTTFSVDHVYSEAPTGQLQQNNVVTVQVVDVHTGLGSGATNVTVNFNGLGPGGNPNGGTIPAFFIPPNTTLSQLTGGGGDQAVLAVQPLVVNYTTVQFDPRSPQIARVENAKPVVALRTVNVVSEFETGVVILPVDVLNNLSALFTKLPDDHYRLYYLDQGTERLIMDVMVRGGRPLDPLDTSEGTQDRPPTSRISLPDDGTDIAQHAEPEIGESAAVISPDELPEMAVTAVLPDIVPVSHVVFSDVVSPAPVPENARVVTMRVEGAKYRQLFAPSVAAVAASAAWTGGRWAQQVDRALAAAPADALTKAARLRRRLRRQRSSDLNKPR